VEKKLSQMILNHRFFGILDQGKGILEVYEGTHDDSAYSKGSEVIANMEDVVDNLFDRVRSLTSVPAVIKAIASK
jgi:26S proteasome regulatory subunit N6